MSAPMPSSAPPMARLGERAGEGDEGLVARAGRLGLDGGGPTEDEERDAADLQPEPAGDDGV